MVKRKLPSEKLQPNNAKAMPNRRILQLETLSRLSQNIHAATDIRSVMRALVKSAIRLVGASEGTSGLILEGKMVFSEYCRGSQWLPVDYSFEAGYGVPGHVMQTKKPYISNDAEHDRHVIAEIQQKLGFHSLIDVPIFGRNNELLGCFEIHNKKHEKTFDEQDLHMLELLSSTASIALENVQAQEELEQSKKRYQSLADATPDAIGIHQHGRWVYVNPAGVRIMGAKGADEIIGKRILDFVHPEDHDIARNLLDVLAAHPTAFPFVEYRGYLMNGEIRALEASACHTTYKGEPAVMAICHDITERKQAEKLLKEKFDEIERMNRLMVGRELKMEELRKEIRILKEEIAALRSRQGPA